MSFAKILEAQVGAKMSQAKDMVGTKVLGWERVWSESIEGEVEVRAAVLFLLGSGGHT